MSTRDTLVFVTTCQDDWGGSEELWSGSIPLLQGKYDRIIVFKNKHNRSHRAVQTLLKSQVILENLDPSKKLFPRLKRKTISLINRLRKPNANEHFNDYSASHFQKKIKKINPSLVVISQAINFDGLIYAHICLQENIPYVLISQKAVDFYWPHSQNKWWMREVITNARENYFVSYHNLRLTENQFGVKINNSKVVFNPIKTAREVQKYPSISNGFNLACIGRFFLIDKGQDMLIQILSQRKWRNRPLTVTFIGAGPDITHIRDMIVLHQISNIKILEFQTDIESLWRSYHALILPSRSEGLPLALTEAMALGRMAIVSNAGGNAEFIEEGVNGFIGEANVSSLDEALERAWDRRYEWETLGRNANSFINENIPPIPEKNFAELLKQLKDEKRTISINHHSYV